MRLRATYLGYVAGCAIAAGEGTLGVLLPPYMTFLGFPVPVIGAFVAFYALAGLLSRLPGGRFYRPGLIRPLIGGSLLLQCLTNVSYVWATDGVTLAVLRLLGGLSYGVCTTVNLAQFIDSLPAAGRRDHAMATYTAALSVGFALGNVTSGVLANAYGYPAGFIGGALFPLLAAVCTLFAEEPRNVRTSRAGAVGPRGLLGALNQPLLRIVLLEALLLNFMFGFHYAIFPLYLLAIGATLAEMGLMRGTFSGTQVVSRIGTGWVLVRFDHRRVALVGLVGQVVSIALLPLTTNLPLLFLLAISYGLWRGIMLVANTLGMAESSDRTEVSRGASSGLYNAAADVGTLLGPLLAGVTAGVIGTGPALFVLAMTVLVVEVAGLALNGRWPRPAVRPVE